MNNFIGIDPGKKGAIAVLHQDRRTVIWLDMPVTPAGEIDVKSIYEFLQPFAPENYICMLERAQSMPKQGVVGVFTYGVGYGKVKACLELLGIKYNEIHPKNWKKEFKLLGKTKEDSVETARKLFSWHSSSYKTPRGRLLDGRAEALLLAEHGRRNIMRSGEWKCCDE